MKLSKDQIKFIDQYLIKNEVKFWDVRLELLDHIVSSVEDKINMESLSFEEAMLEVHRGFGNQLIKGSVTSSEDWTNGLYQANNGFKKFIRTKQRELARKHRRLYRKTFPKFLTSGSFTLEFFAIIAAVYLIALNSITIGFILSYGMLFVFETAKLFIGFKDKSLRYSLNAQMLFPTVCLSSVCNFFIVGCDVFFPTDKNLPFVIFTIVALIFYPFVRHGFNLFRRVVKESRQHCQSLSFK